MPPPTHALRRRATQFKQEFPVHLLNPYRQINWNSKRRADEEESRGQQASASAPAGQDESGSSDNISAATTHAPYTIANQLQRTFLRAPINVLLLLVPVGVVLHVVNGRSITSFIINYLAALPLYMLAEAGIGEISLRVGEIFGGLLYLSTCNLVQLISCILLLLRRETEVLQTTLTGSILANLLFTLGLSLAVGGRSPRIYQYFNPVVAHVSSNILSLAATSLLIPTASKLLSQASPNGILQQSRGASVVLVLVYFLYLYYQLRSHIAIFKARVGKSPSLHVLDKQHKHMPGTIFSLGIDDKLLRPGGPHAAEADDMMGGHHHHNNNHHPPNRGAATTTAEYHGNEEAMLTAEEAQPGLHVLVALALFLASTALLYFSIDFVIASVEALMETANVSRTFVGLIIFPLPNCDFAAITYAIEDRVDITMNYTIGKCLQTALFVTPMVVLIAWWAGVPDVTLAFDSFQVVSVFSAVVMLNFLIITGRGGWIQGVLLFAEWALIGIAAFFVD